MPLAEANASKTTTEGELVTVRQQLVTANASLQTTRDALEDANDNLKDAQDDLDDLKDAQDNLQTANDELARVKKERDDAVRAQAIAEGTLEGLRAQLTQAQQDVVDAEQRRREGEAEANRRIEQAEQQGDVDARALEYLTAINGGGMDRSVTVSYERGSTLMIDPGGNFVSGSGAPSISGFTARTYTREVGVTGEQTVFLYTNIQGPGTRAFWKVHGVEVTDAHADTDQKPTPGTSLRHIINTDDSTMTTGLRISGTYDGVSGTYECNGGIFCADLRTDIELSNFVVTTGGVRSFVSGNGKDWDFEPSSITSGVRQNEDTEHLYFGIWVNEPNLANETHGYQYIVGGSDVLPTYDNLAGTARFAGGAVGKYVTRNQVGEPARIGTFTAAVNLTANFDADTLEGRITDFRDGSQQLAGWNVYLGASATGPITSFSGSVTVGVATASIGGVAATGAWGAMLRGTDNDLLGYDVNSPPGVRDLTKYPLTRYPVADLAGIVGNFHATSAAGVEDANAAIAGAFAATP